MKRFVVVEYFNDALDERELKGFETEKEAMEYIETLRSEYGIMDETEEGWFIKDSMEVTVDTKLEKVAELEKLWNEGYLFIDKGFDEILNDFSDVKDMVNEVHYGHAGLELKIDVKGNKTVEMVIIDHWKEA